MRAVGDLVCAIRSSEAGCSQSDAVAVLTKLPRQSIVAITVRFIKATRLGPDLEVPEPKYIMAHASRARQTLSTDCETLDRREEQNNKMPRFSCLLLTALPGLVCGDSSSGCPARLIRQQPSAFAASLPRGVVAVTGADPTGTVDSTDAFQHAITTARTQNITLWVPLGCYRITRTLEAVAPRNGRWQPTVIVGEIDRSSSHGDDDVPLRPTLWLPPRTPLFSVAAGASALPLISFTCNWCLAPGAATNGTAVPPCNAESVNRNFAPYNFNHILQGVDVELGAGNGRAVGVQMRAAQGAALQDVTVRAAPDAFAGVAGGNGGGGSFVRVRVVGARYGIDVRRAQGTPTMVATTLLNQSCAALLVGSPSGSGGARVMPSTLVGFRIAGAHRLGAVLAGVAPPDEGPCVAPGVSVGGNSELGSRFEQPKKSGDDSVHQLGSALSLVDGTITSLPFTAAADGGGTAALAVRQPCVVANASLYMSNVLTGGCAFAVRANGAPDVASAVDDAAAAATHVPLLGLGRRTLPTRGPRGSPYAYSFPVYVNGSRLVAGLVAPVTAVTPPAGAHSAADLAARGAAFVAAHSWAADDGGNGATWQTQGAVNVLDVGAVGDGVADDWAALQMAVDAHDVVCLPKGLYRLSRPLVLSRHGGALVGVGRTLVFLLPLTGGLSRHGNGGQRRGDGGGGSSSSSSSSVRSSGGGNGDETLPLLHVQATGSTVFGLTLAPLNHRAAYALEWSAPSGVFRQAFANRVNESTFPPFFPLQHGGSGGVVPHAGTPADRALSVISGGGLFYDFNLDFGCCFGTLLPLPASKAAPGPGVSSLSDVALQTPAWRTLLVNGSTSGLRMYAHNTEQTFGDAHTEIAFSSNVSFFGAKTEDNFVAIWIRDSSAVRVHSFGGDFTPFANTSRYPGVPLIAHPAASYADFMPSTFRVQRSTDVRLANLIDTGRVTREGCFGGSASPACVSMKPTSLVAAGYGVDPRLWNMVLYQDGDDRCDPATGGACWTTAVLDRPVIWTV